MEVKLNEEKVHVSLFELVASAQSVLQAAGLGSEFRHGTDVALYRWETTDRNIEVVARPRHWTISYMHVTTKKAIRLRGDDTKSLERSLRPLCEETAFEPPVGESRFKGR